MSFTELAPVPSDPAALFTDRLRLAVAAYLARFKGSSREHTESDLRCYLACCAEQGLDPRNDHTRFGQELVDLRFQRSRSNRFLNHRRLLSL